MPSLLARSESGVRIVSRRSARDVVNVRIRLLRPSLLDLRLRGDSWLAFQGDDNASVFFDGCALVALGAVELDGPNLNSQLHALRNRRPRARR
jgi:hypothetical protein